MTYTNLSLNDISIFSICIFWHTHGTHGFFFFVSYRVSLTIFVFFSSNLKRDTHTQTNTLYSQAEEGEGGGELFLIVAVVEEDGGVGVVLSEAVVGDAGVKPEDETLGRKVVGVSGERADGSEHHGASLQLDADGDDPRVKAVVVDGLVGFLHELYGEALEGLGGLVFPRLDAGGLGELVLNGVGGGHDADEGGTLLVVELGFHLETLKAL